MLQELASDGRNLDNEMIAMLYNTVASKLGWNTILAGTVANWKLRNMDVQYVGRHGVVAHRNNKAMQVKRRAPRFPLYYWTVDGWDVELLYQQREEREKNGKKYSVVTYSNRPTVVMLLDPCTRYPVGYAIGTHETPELIREAFRNAFKHVKELFGHYYKPWQLQTDNYGKKTLLSFYEACTRVYTPARVKNAKAKVVEPYFKKVNSKYCHLLPNWSGYGVTSRKENQPNDEWLNQNRHKFPGWDGVVGQVEGIIRVLRSESIEKYRQAWGKMAVEDRLEMSDEEYLKNPVGTGPYMLKDWTQGSSLTLEANPYYRVEGMPKTKEIKYVLIADDNTRLMQLQSGQIDVAPTFPFSLAQGVESNEALALDIFPSTQIYYLTVNTTKPPFDDVKVRQALYYALNKSELASAIAGEYGTPVAAIVSETQGDWCNTDLQVTEYAPDTAKQMLADAGYTEPVEFTLSIRTGSTFYEQIATLIKSEVDQAGFSCNIELLESATLTDKYSSQSHQATILQWVDDYQDPSGVVGWTVDYDQAQCFYTGLNDEELDALYMAAQTEMDHDKRVEMYRDIQQQVYDNANVIPLYRNDFAFARSAKVDGLQVNPFYVYQAMYWTKAN